MPGEFGRLVKGDLGDDRRQSTPVANTSWSENRRDKGDGEVEKRCMRNRNWLGENVWRPVLRKARKVGWRSRRITPAQVLAAHRSQVAAIKFYHFAHAQQENTYSFEVTNPSALVKMAAMHCGRAIAVYPTDQLRGGRHIGDKSAVWLRCADCADHQFAPICRDLSRTAVTPGRKTGSLHLGRNTPGLYPCAAGDCSAARLVHAKKNTIV